MEEESGRYLKGEFFTLREPVSKKKGRKGEIRKKERGADLQGWSGRDMRADHTGPVLFKGHGHYR